MPKSYSVTGKSSVKPTNLPQGLEVQETVERIEAVFPAAFGRELTIKDSQTFEGGAWIKMATKPMYDQPTYVCGHVERDELIKVRDHINVILGQDQGLRKLVDSSDYANVWFEIEPNKFYNQNTREDAESLATRGGPHRTLESITSAYGVDSITFE